MPHIFPLRESWRESRIDECGNLYIRFGLPESPAVLSHEINHLRLGYYGEKLPKEPLACLRAEVKIWKETLKCIGSEWNEFAIKCLATYRMRVATYYGDYSPEDYEAALILDEFEELLGRR